METDEDQKSTLSGRDLLRNGWQPGPLLGQAIRAGNALINAGRDRQETLEFLKRVNDQPEQYEADPRVGDLALAVAGDRRKLTARQSAREPDRLRANPLPYPTWGADQIDQGATQQMAVAMRLPISVAGALMADAHVGYGLPIGGVLATENSVIPYGIGVDIACRMRLTIFVEDIMKSKPRRLEHALQSAAYFGAGVSNPRHPEHPVLDDPSWRRTALLWSLQQIGKNQLGTSGSGNHFVEFGELEIVESMPGIPDGKYLALLSHSGSRGVGFKIASHYTKVAKLEHPEIEKAAANLSWLDLDSEAGLEYWDAMELAGRFAAANHEVIHHAVADEANLTELVVVENHHNYAWKQEVEGRQLVVHRKGATPAGPGVLGVIPGSMGDPGFIVRGRGSEEALNSASHGAGRAMGRREAQRRLTREKRDQYLKERGVTLLGGGLDESPQAYKRIEAVMAAQSDLVDVVGVFRPRIVRMDKGGGPDI